MSKPTVYAIDFGTSNSLLAAANKDEVFAPIPLDPGAEDPTVLRSILFFPSQRRVFYGSAALKEYVANGLQGRLIRSIKKHLPSRSFMGTYIEERPMRLEDLVGAFLMEMRKRANAHFGVDVTRVVLGRPALFSTEPLDDVYAQNRLERAAKIAGFTDVEFCAEPLAAARDFAGELDTPKTVFVADFGGGTSDFTVLKMRPDGYDPSDVLAIGGVAVAGDALDGSIMRSKIATHFGAEVTYKVPFGSNVLTMPKTIREKLCSPADLSVLQQRDARAFLDDVRSWSLGPDDRRRIDQLFTLVEDALGFQIFERIERVKRDLSTQESSELVFQYPTIDVRETVSRDDFLSGSTFALRAITDSLDATMAASKLAASDIDLVCSTGGTAKVRSVADALSARFSSAKVMEHRSFHSVILGLAERAQAMARA
jgi:hypothetical chaperone protein